MDFLLRRDLPPNLVRLEPVSSSSPIFRRVLLGEGELMDTLWIGGKGVLYLLKDNTGANANLTEPVAPLSGDKVGASLIGGNFIPGIKCTI